MTRGVWCVCWWGWGGRVAWTDTGPNNDDDNSHLTGQRMDEYRPRGQGRRAAVSSLFYWLSSSRTSVSCTSQFCPNSTWEATAAAVQPLRLGLSKPTHSPELAVTTSELPVGVMRSGLPEKQIQGADQKSVSRSMRGGSGIRELRHCLTLPSLPGVRCWQLLRMLGSLYSALPSSKGNWLSKLL